MQRNWKFSKNVLGMEYHDNTYIISKIIRFSTRLRNKYIYIYIYIWGSQARTTCW